MTDLDALDRAFLKGSGVPSLPNKGKSAVVDPIDAAFMRGLGLSPIAEDPESLIDEAEVANTPRRVPFTPTPVSPLAMAGAIIRGAGEGLAQGARDVGVTAGKSIIGVGENAVGLVDIASAPVQAIFSKLSTGRVQLGQVGKMLEDIGVDFKTTQDILSTLYSDEQKQALQNVSEKKSAKEKLVALGANPTVPIHSVLQSIPSMMAAASVSAPLAERGMVKWLAGALGEGAVQASSAQEQYRQQSDTGYTTPKQTSLAVASGLVTAAIAAASGKISEKIGLEDVESIGASGSSRGSNLEFWRKLVGGMFMEGPVEEGFQSSTEKIAENLALGRPWDEGVEGAYTEGSVSGAIMGAAANALPSKGKSKSAPKLDAAAWIKEAAAWIKENADMLPTIAAKEKLGRKYWEKLGLPRVPEAVRAAFLQKVKDTVAEPKFPEPGSVLPQPAKDALLPKPSGLELPLNEETKARIQKVRAEVQAELDAPTEAEAEANKPAETPVVAEAESVAERKKGKRVPKAPVPEANAAVDEVQAELNAQAAEDAADEAAYALFGKREAKTPVPDATATPVEPEAPVPTDTAAEVVKPVEAPVVAEAKAVEERKKGKRVPKAPKPVNKGKGVVEPVVETPVVKESLSTPVEQPTTREVKTGLKGQTKTVPVEIPTNGEPTTTIVGRMDMAEFERMGYEPDEVTRQNWVDLQRAERRRLGQREEGDNPNAPWAEYEEFHRDSVKRSLAKGDVVDERVLADYPELQTREVKTGRKGVTKKAGGESVLPSAANAVQPETIEGRFIKQLPSGRWVVQSEENRQRAERGEREIGGDRLFASREEAVKETKLEIEIDRRNAALKATEAAAQAEREAAAAKREAPLNAYLDTITTTPLQRGKLKTTLSKQVARRVSSTGKVYSGSKFEVVNQMVGDGFKADAVEVDAIKDVSRVQWNRMDERQQREWDARRKAAGKKTEYRLVNTERGNFYDISKTEYDYAKSLEADAAQPSASKATPEKPAGVATSGQRQEAMKDASAKGGALPKAAEKAASEQATRDDYEPAGLREMSIKPTAAQVKNWSDGTYKGKPVYSSSGIFIDLSGTEPHLKGWADRRDPTRTHIGEEAVENIVHSASNQSGVMKLEPVALNDAPTLASKKLAVFSRIDSQTAVYVDLKYVSYFLSKFKGAELYTGEPNKSGGYAAIQVRHGGDLVGILMPIHLREDAHTPIEIRGFMKASGKDVAKPKSVVQRAKEAKEATASPEAAEADAVAERKKGKRVPKAPESEAAAKEPWQMTRQEIIDRDKKLWGDRSDEAGQHAMLTAHEAGVSFAVRDGKPVPAEVLADYPELAKKAAEVAPAATASTPPAPLKAKGRAKPVGKNTAIYNGTEVEVEDFKQAAMRVSDNLPTGEHGYVKSPDGKLYEIVSNQKGATLVPEMRTKNAREIAELEGRITKAKSDNERAVLTKRLEDLKAKTPAPSPVKVETEPVLDSKGRTPEQLARMTANARALKEASAKEGALPKPKTPKNLTESDLAALNFNELINYRSETTEGVAKNRGKTYRKATIDAYDADGVEHTYEVKASSSEPGVTLKKGKKTQGQIDREDASTWNGYNEAIRNEVNRLWPEMNQYQKNVMASLYTGGRAKEFNDGTVQAVIGGRGREAFNANFPGLDSIDAIRKAMSDKGKELVSSSSIKKQSKPNPVLVSSVAKAKAEGNDIELVDTVSDLPSDIRSQLRSDTSNIEGFYVNGKTYIIGENVTPDRAEAVVREEMAHRKLDTAKGEELIDGFKKRMTEKDRKALIKEGYTKTQGESDADYEARLANEFIAKQARKNTSAWTEFVDSVKAFLESVGVRDLTSEEAARVILRKLRGGAATGKGVRYSLREQDAAYMDAVNSGDMDAAQKMVDEAAKRAGVPIEVRQIESLKPLVGFKPDSQINTNDTRPILIDSTGTVLDGNHRLEAAKRRGDTTINVVISKADKNTGRLTVNEDYQRIYLGKSADAVTYDDAGRVVPLSERFNADSNDIRYSLTPAAELDEAKYESAKGIFGTKLERLGEAGFRKWVSEKLPDSAMPYAERFLSERSAMATVPKKKFVTGISRKVVDAELESMGQTPSEGGGQPSWPQLMAQAKADIKANSSAGDSLVANLVKNPRPLTAEEIALLNHVKVQRWNERDAAYKSGDKNRLEVAEARMEEVYFVSTLGPDKSKSMMGGALNALKMMTDEKYELVNLVQSHYATTGDVAKPGSQVYKDLEAIAQQYKERTEVLERENARLQEEATTMNQSLADALAQAAYNQGKPKSKGKSKASKIASVADVISKKSRDYGISLIEQARKEQAALNMRASAGVDPARLLMLSKFAAGHILLGVSDVAAKVSEFYGSKISSAEMSQIMSEANKIVLDARNRFVKEAESESLGSRVIAKGKGAKTATQLSEVSLKDMFREQAENGVKTFKEALPLVGKLVRDSGINATDLQIQDTYSSYINEPGVLSTDTIKKITAAYRQEAQLLSKINDAKKGVRPHKIGIPRFPSSQEARALEKELDDLMKNVTFSGDKKPTDIASPLDAKKTWMQNEIDDLEKAIALHEERFQGEKGITDQGDIEYQRLKAQLEDARKRYDEAFPKKPLTQEEQLAILIKQEEKNVDRWNKRVADAKSGKFKSYERVQRPYSERLAELQYQRDNAKAEVARLYELQNPGKRAREAQMKRDLAAIKEMNRRMAAGDYTTPTTTTMDLSGDAPAMAAHVAREQTKKTYEQYKARAAWNKLTPGRKLLIVAKNLLMSDKAFVYSADDSYPGRQGWMFALTHTEKWFKTSKRGLSAASSKNSAQIIQEIKENELYKSGVLKAAGLNINVKDATGQYGSEDDANLEFVNKIPVYGEVTKVSGRMFGATANLQRLEFLTTILEGSKFGREILADPYHRTDAQNEFLKHVGWGVNVFTGFAGNNIIKPGFMLGAPNWVFSVLLNFGQVPVLNALFDGDWKAAAALEKEYGRFYLATLSLISAMSLLPSGPKDDEGKRKRHRVVLDPRSNRFGIGYIPYTSIQINAFGPRAPWIHFIGMNVTGQKIVGGEISNLRNSFLWTHTEEQKAKGVPWKGEQWREDLKFLRGKFRPLVTTAMGLRDGLSYDGKETPRLRLLFESYQPLTPLHFIENLVRVPPGQAAAETLMEFFGFDSKPDFNTPQYKKYEAKMKVVDEMFKMKFKDENGKSFGDRAEDIYIANAMKTLHRATDTNSSLGLQESAKMMIDDLGMDACLVLLYHQARAKSLSMGSTKEPTERTKDGNLTAYGKRVQKLWIISAQ